jgi:signal peptidase I
MMPNVFIPADARLEQAEQSRVARPKAASKAHYGVLATFRSLLEFLVVALFVLTFILQPFRIPSESMVPTLRVGDFLMVDKQSYEPEGALYAPGKARGCGTGRSRTAEAWACLDQ